MKRFLVSAIVLMASVSSTLAQDWQVSVDRSPVDDSETVELKLRSQKPFTDRFGRKKWGFINISCIENSTSFTIWPGGEFVAASGEFGYVTYRIDKNKAQKKFMSESTDNEVLGLWYGLGIDLIREISEGKTLFIRITPYNESPVDLTFQVGGLKKVLPKVQKACGWQ
jgi:type VI secretion system protein VasI